MNTGKQIPKCVTCGSMDIKLVYYGWAYHDLIDGEWVHTIPCGPEYVYESGGKYHCDQCNKDCNVTWVEP